MRTLTSIFVIITLLNSTCNHAQDQPKIVVFNSPKLDKNPIDVKNIIKFSILDAFSGDFSISYERELYKNLSGEISLGLTLSDYFTSLYNSDIDVFNETYIAEIGSSFSLGTKYYPNNLFEDFYFGLDYKHKTYKNNRKFNFSDDFYPEKRSINVARLSFGYNYFFEDKILLDLFGGFGIGSISKTRTNQKITYDQATGENVYTYETSSGKRLTPRIHLGIKIGVAF